MREYNSFEEYLESPLTASVLDQAKKNLRRYRLSLRFSLLAFIATFVFIALQYDVEKHTVLELLFIGIVSAFISYWFAKSLHTVIKPADFQVKITHYSVNLRSEISGEGANVDNIVSENPSVKAFIGHLKDQNRAAFPFEVDIVDAVTKFRRKGAL